MKKPASVGFLLFMAVVAFAAGRYSKPTSGTHAANKRILYYVDPMHPAYRSAKPGIAPDCGMDLVPIYEGDNLADKVELPDGAVTVSPEKQQLIGVRVEMVEHNTGSRVIRTTGRLEAEDNRVYRLTAATEGWVQSLQENAVGTVVRKNEVLASFYSHEFRNAQQAFLGALSSSERVKTGGSADDPNSVLRTNEEQLRALGMGEPQIRELARKRQTTRDISVVSPVDGIVLARNISPEQRFEKGTELYRIADLSKMWIVADLFNDQARVLRAGRKVKATVREMSRSISATVTENPPLFDPLSRTLKLRLEADNPGMALRPDMFVDLEYRAEAPAGLSVPAEAILDSGLRKIVYVQTAENIFEPRTVEVGFAYGNRITVTRGLAAGDRIVSSGNFLLDSESRIRSNTLHATSTKQATRMMPNTSTGEPNESTRR
jgi:membrane fusion protein, copper/silver efflux system